jgi:hypothetical protein
MNGHLHLCGLSSEFSETSEKECVHYYGDGKCNHLSNYGSDCDDIEYVPISELQSTLTRVTAERDEARIRASNDAYTAKEAIEFSEKYKAERNELLKMIRIIPCECPDGFKSRKLTDPDCPRCNWIDDDTISRIDEGK